MTGSTERRLVCYARGRWFEPRHAGRSPAGPSIPGHADYLALKPPRPQPHALLRLPRPDGGPTRPSGWSHSTRRPINHHGTDPNQVADPGKAGHPRSQPAHRTQPLNTQPLTEAAAQKSSSEALTAQIMYEALVGGTPTDGHLA